LEAIDGLKGLDESILGEVSGILPIRNQVIDNAENPLAVFDNQSIKRGHLSSLHLTDDNQIRIRFLLTLGSGNGRPGKNLRQIHRANRQLMGAKERRKSNLW
jgi:hypothetical protein